MNTTSRRTSQLPSHTMPAKFKYQTRPATATTTTTVTVTANATTAATPSPLPRHAHHPAVKVNVVRGKPVGMATVSRELPVPNVSRIFNLSQAHATLLHCWNRLSRFTREAAAPAPAAPATLAAVAEARAEYLRWLERWEQAFTDFLATAMPSMATDDLMQCRVLKANHLACTILASDASPQTPDFDAFEPDFQAILELAGAVLQTRQAMESPGSATSAGGGSSHDAPVPTGLDVRDPIWVVATRCNRRALRERANELLARHFR